MPIKKLETTVFILLEDCHTLVNMTTMSTTQNIIEQPESISGSVHSGRRVNQEQGATETPP